jgi:uncharacterized HAD superfamily protein/hypoxanthine phosphoribosyltransferase
MPQYRAPIGIMSFDRPDYFEKVLQSLVLQTGGELGSRRIYLFQDGARNPFSGNTYASQDKINNNIGLFKRYLPHGVVLDSQNNLGVALNYDRAERLFFEERGDDAAIFLEDDLILSPFYIEVLDRLVEIARNDPRIGYVSAVGNHMLSLDEQRRRRHELATLQQTWGFALTRRQWIANQPYLEKYLKLVRGIDYRKRSHLDIFDLYTSWGASRSLSSQDRTKYIASTLNANLWISTVPSFGKYIGAIGLHCNEEMYAAGRFGETNLFPEPLESFTELSDEQYRALLDQQLREISAIMQVNRELSFGTGHNGFLALGTGFHLPEKWGVWAATKTPRITVQPPDTACDGEHALRIKCRYNMPPGQSEISVAVRIDGKEAGWLRWNGTQQALVVPLPRADASRGEPMTVEFLAPVVGRPSDIHRGGDTRPLGLGLHSLTIVSDAEIRSRAHAAEGDRDSDANVAGGIRMLWWRGNPQPLETPSSPLQFRSINDLNLLIKKKLDLLNGRFDFVVGIPRSGLLPANLIALYLNLPLLTVNDLLTGRCEQTFTARKLSRYRARHDISFGLVVDDSVNEGATLSRTRQMLAEAPGAQNRVLTYLAVYAAPGAGARMADLLLEVVSHPRVFEWNMFHHGAMEHCLVDLDGVLCPDGPPENSNDGGLYEEYIRTADVKLLPSWKIGAVVSSRLEKYRSVTQDWLDRNEITYKQLFMLDLRSPELRRKLGAHGAFKADVFNELGGMLFVESEEWQAREINKRTNRPVFCLDTAFFLHQKGICGEDYSITNKRCQGICEYFSRDVPH